MSPPQRSRPAGGDPEAAGSRTATRDNTHDTRRGAKNAELSLFTGWRLWAEDELDRLIDTGRPFTADDLRSVVGDPPDGAHVNGVGSLFTNATRAGRILMVGYRPSSRPQARGRVLRVWRGA